ncbi:30S ribosomal protein S7 [Candidatus Parvarchaeota archaeon]|jgi:small subunit ribosomal protein S7|nr:MAG: 30S ribosomal protein S7 [Candidatus Parvarchaeota archaeon]HIG52057.1 30S ribosomal protein S7 [Candidatus Pacearchaeota archaeon]
MEFKVFDLYDMKDIEISDEALKPYINVEGKLLIKTYGRNIGKFASSKSHIVERMANRISVPGHVGKKHKIITSWASGKYSNSVKIIIEAFEIIERKKNENPVQVLIKAIEKSSPRDEITTIEYGGARYPQAVDVSPLRRVNLSIRWIVQGSYQKCFGKKKKMAESLANEIILASEENMESYAMKKKNESEKQADAAR